VALNSKHHVDREASAPSVVNKYRTASVFTKILEIASNTFFKIASANHHPKWESEWVYVVVRLTTWDIGRKVSALDVDLAFYLEDLYMK